ncbi:unnamed protein product [Triticum turgidum subsp. durum]|uniref:Uncharacterized protein n=1 Tax=Triticum turgidum subsp. durum TaxID=4567 RepID=A0A9R0Q4A4_TRITD|nr:unnamed protein product [Triticum turgidum subsp. durum]
MMNRRIDSPEEEQMIGGVRKRRQGQASYSERTGKKLEKQKHLYLLIDDWSKGFTLHKIDKDTNYSDLREPGVLRLIAPVPRRCMTFAAMGGNIFITTNPPGPGCRCFKNSRLTETAGLAVGPPLPEPLLCHHRCVATTDALYAFPCFVQNTQQDFFQAMSLAPTENDDPWAPRPTMDWRWQSVPSPWPFTKEVIDSYALHPDGRTIFLTAHSKYDGPSPCPSAMSTFSFDTKGQRWRSHGDWPLPFRGQGYFDSQLDAWVGLQKDGTICSCQVASRTSTTQSQPDWKTVKERFFSKPPDSKRRLAAPMDATLTHLGNAQFCLVECATRGSRVQGCFWRP